MRPRSCCKLYVERQWQTTNCDHEDKPLRGSCSQQLRNQSKERNLGEWITTAKKYLHCHLNGHGARGSVTIVPCRFEFEDRPFPQLGYSVMIIDQQRCGGEAERFYEERVVAPTECTCLVIWKNFLSISSTHSLNPKSCRSPLVSMVTLLRNMIGIVYLF